MSAGSCVGKGYMEIGRIKGEENKPRAGWGGGGGAVVCGVSIDREQVREMRNKWIKK